MDFETRQSAVSQHYKGTTRDDVLQYEQITYRVDGIIIDLRNGGGSLPREQPVSSCLSGPVANSPK
jgi:C-terminal processing protease CtpA/Prc